MKLIIIYVLLLNRRNIIIILIPFIDKKNWKTEEPHGEKKTHENQTIVKFMDKPRLHNKTYVFNAKSICFSWVISFLRYMSQECRHQIVFSSNSPEYTNDRIYISTYFRLFYIEKLQPFRWEPRAAAIWM